MALNISNMGEPYVHSNIYNFIGNVTDALNDIKKEKHTLNDIAKKFENWASVLENYEKEIYNFCNVDDYIGLNKKLFGSVEQNHWFNEMVQKVLTNPDFIYALVPKISKPLQEQFAQQFPKRFANKLLKTIGEDNQPISLIELKKALVLTIQQSFTNGKISQEEANKKLGKSFIKNAKRKFSAQATSKDSIMGQAVRESIKNFSQTVYINEAFFVDTFIKFFNKQWSSENIVLGEDIQDRIRTTGIEIFKLINDNGSLTGYITDILGNIGEGILDIAVQNISDEELQIQVIQVGKKTEDEIVKTIKDINSNINFNKMHNWHADNKQSQTDVVLVLNHKDKGTKTVRIQSKNSLLQQVKDYDTKQNNVPMVVRMVDNISINSLLQKLESAEVISKEDSNIIAYYLANFMWFYNKGTRDRNGKVSLRNTGKGSGLFGAKKLITAYLSKGLAYFIGLTLNQASDEPPLDLSASNIFYLLGARTLFPVSKILREVVRRLREEEKDFSFYTHLTLDNSLDSYAYESAETFFKAKQDAVQVLDAKKNYSDSALLDVGRTQGGSIMDNVQGHLNFNFAIIKILQVSSYLV